MGISFQDSLTQRKAASISSFSDAGNAAPQIVVDSGDFTACADGRYDTYNQYSDDKYSIADVLKM